MPPIDGSFDPTSNNSYSDIQTRLTDAYRAYEATYEQSTPKPTLAQVARRYPANNRLMYRLLGLLVTASVIVSGSHTIPVFAESLPAGTHPLIVLLVGGAAFVAIEAAILIYAYQRVEKSHATNPNKSAEVQKLMGYGLALSIAVALGANVYSVLKPHMVGEFAGAWDIMKIGVSVLVGISAPVLAFIAGELFGLLTVEARARQGLILGEYDAAVEAWRDGLRDAWARDRNRWGAGVRVERSVSAVPSIPLEFPMENHGTPGGVIPARSSLGHAKTPDAAEKVRAYLEQNPDAASMSGMALANLLGVGKSTAYAVLKEHKNQ